MDKPRSHYYLQICKSIVRYFFLCIKYTFKPDSSTKKERREYLVDSIYAMENGTPFPFKPIGFYECSLGLKYSFKLLKHFYSSKKTSRRFYLKFEGNPIGKINTENVVISNAPNEDVLFDVIEKCDFKFVKKELISTEMLFLIERI